MNLVRTLLVLFVSFNLSLLVTARSNIYRIVQTNSGLVKGIRHLTLFTNRTYFAFKGIPYAVPPINDLRFKAPVSVKPWSGIMDTFVEGNQCLQPSKVIDIYNNVIPTPNIFGDEDCLYLNVYTPNIFRNLPVMVVINGGLFSEGSTIYYGPDFIVNENVILVTFTHRLGPFGFLSLGTKEYEGNMAIKDVILALKWINTNIEKFGGDKYRITVAGYTSGATIAHWLIVSGEGKQLFRRAILMSGSLLNIWGINERQNHLKELFKFARLTDPLVRSIRDLIQFLQNVDGKYLLENFIQIINVVPGWPRKKIANYIWSPIIKKSPNTYFNDEILKYNSTIDTMFGFTSKESISFVHQEIKHPKLLKSFNEKYEVQLPLNHDNNIQYDSKAYENIAKEIHDVYFGAEGVANEKTMSQYVDLASDMWMRYAIYLSAKIQARSSSGRTFLYEFSIDDQLNMAKIFLNVSFPGAATADDIAYLFKVPIPKFYEKVTANSVAYKAITHMSKLWTNFVKYGDPSIRDLIQPIRNDEINFFNITNDGIVLGKNPRAKAMELWDKIYSRLSKILLKENVEN